ncbi:MAG: DUF5753 domain-containing protein [Actinophytocola sp.]|uniref:DUF5753 domain-containing protein n=1 Tax=Actinophytocola sp. TaxID=1872138 RepID=UPI003C781152
MSAREVARQLDISHTKVNRWLDDGERAPDVTDTASFLARINVTGPERDRILSIARGAEAETDWLVAGPPGINPVLASVLECERHASRIFEFQLVWWPGLLQCSDYGRALIRAGETTITGADLESRVMIRTARRDVLTRRTSTVRLDAVVGLPAIHGMFGGTLVRTAQLEHVRDLTNLKNVTLQAIDVGTVWTPGSSFIVYEFEDLPTTVFMENHRSSAFIVEDADVRAYQDTADQLRREAMSPADTAKLIVDAIPNNSMEMTE